MVDNTVSRRTILKASTVAIAGLAGCASTSGNESDSGPAGTAHDEETDSHGGSHEGDSHEETTSHDDGGHGDDSHGEGGHDHGGSVSGPADHATVTMVTTDDGFHFDPHVVWVKPGGTVTWELESGSHTTTAYHPDNGRPARIPEGATPWDSGTMSEQGATFEHTFEQEGVYDYFCLPHEGPGMLGSVIVGQPDAHGQPGLAEPQDSLPEKTRTKISDLNAKVNEALGHTH
jgi:plastocyanin